MKLRRVYETADEEGRPVQEVALDRFGSLEEFEAAREERRMLDERDGKRVTRGGSDKGKGKESEGERRYMFTDMSASGGSSRGSTFKRPGLGDSAPSTPSPAGEAPKKTQYDSLRLSYKGSTGSPLAQPHTPIPSVMTPGAVLQNSKRRALSPSSLNRLQAKVLRAKLMDDPNAASMEKEYEEEVRRANGQGDNATEDVQTQVKLLPTLDGRGRLYDLGEGKEDVPPPSGNRKKNQKARMSRWRAWSTTLMIKFRWRPETQRPESSSVTTRTTTRLLLARCSGKKDLVPVLLIRRTWTHSLRARLQLMVAS